MDPAEILTSVLRRNALRREAKLPLLPVRETVEKELLDAQWRAFCDQHAQSVWNAILAEKRAQYPDWGNSAGGQMALHHMTAKVLSERFARDRRDR